MQDSALSRSLDRTLGALLCRGISALRRLTSAFRKPSAGPPKSVLLIELFEMGAAVMMVPSINWLISQDPDLQVHVLTSSSCAPVWLSLNSIPQERIHIVESRSMVGFVRSLMKTVFGLRSTVFDLIVDFELFMRISAIVSGMLKAKRRSGFYKYDLEGLYRGEFYDYRCAFNQNAHISRNFLALTKTAFQGRIDSPNHKEAIPRDEITVTPVLRHPELPSLVERPYIAVCPDVGKTLSVRNYPQEHFARVLDDLLSGFPSHGIVMIGTEENRGTSEAILSRLSSRGRCVDLCGKTTFRELLGVIAGADLLITNDNGPAHFATLTGTRTLALFSTDSPYMYGPIGNAVVAYSFYQCSPCIFATNHKRSRCDDNRCLQALSPADVVQYARLILENRANFGTINNRIPYLAP